MNMPEDNCPICKDVFNNKVTRDPCGHEFCKSCLDQWYKSAKKNICPFCRQTNEENDNLYFPDYDLEEREIDREEEDVIIRSRLYEENDNIYVPEGFNREDNPIYNREDNIHTCFESQNERHDLNFTVEQQFEDFPIIEDSLNLIIEEDATDCEFKAHPNTLKMLMENNIDISIYLKMGTQERTCIQIKMNLDEIISDGKVYINLNLRLDDGFTVVHEINTKKIRNTEIENLYFYYKNDYIYGLTGEISNIIYSKSLIKKSFISSLITHDYKFFDTQDYKEFDLKFEINNEKNIELKPGLLLINYIDGQWKIKALSETYKFIIINLKDIDFSIKISSNLSKLIILIDIFSVKSRLTTYFSKIKINIDKYEKDEEIKCYKMSLFTNDWALSRIKDPK